MYKLIYSLIVFTFLISCTPTNNPTPTTTTTTTPPPTGGGGTISTTLSDIQGLWEYNAELRNYSVAGGGTTKVLTVKYNNNCKLELTNTIFNNSPTGIQYQGYGLPNNCSHPNGFIYTYDQNSNLISSSYHVDKVTNDSLILSSYSFLFYYSHNQLSLSTTSSINWNVMLDASYPNSNDIGILIEYGGIGNPIKDTIPIVSGQLTYSGNKIVNTASSYPMISIKILNLNQTNNSNNLITLKTKLDIVGTDLSTGWSGTHSYCHSLASTTGCNGFDFLLNQSNNLSQIIW